MNHTHSDCLLRSNHHCHHAHKCTNPNHSKSKSRSHEKTIPINTKPISQETRHRQPQTTNANIKTRCRQTSPHEQAVIDKLSNGLREKQKRIEELQQQLTAVRNRKSVQSHAVSPNPACMVRKEDYEAMYRYVQFENQRLALELQQMKALRDIAQLELEIQREKVKQLERSLVEATCAKERLAFLEAEVSRLGALRKQHEQLASNCKKYQQELAELRNKLSAETNTKEKSKETAKVLQQTIKKMNEERQQICREKDAIKTKYEQHARHNVQLTQKLKEIKQRNRISLEELQQQCKQKVKSADIKFGFSCDQINTLRNSQTKLKARVKQLQEALKNKSQKQVRTKQTRIEKELRSMYDRSTKDNETLRQKTLKYQQQNQQLKDTLRQLRTKSEMSNKQMQQLLKLKDLQNEKLNTARLQTQEEIRRLKLYQKNNSQEFQIKGKEGDPRSGGTGGPGGKGIIAREQDIKKPSDPNQGARNLVPGGLDDLFGGKENQDLFGMGGGNSNQIVIIKRLQQRNAQLQGQVQTMRGRLGSLEKQGSSWTQFQNIIKQNNRRIKELII